MEKEIKTMLNYRTNHGSQLNDGYSTILREAAEYFAGQRIQMMGNGFDEIISEQSLFDTYVEKLSEGLSADEAVEIGQLLENARTQILQEASIANITPISALSMPTIRKMWVRIALKNALPTEAVKQPKFSISYMLPFLLDADGTRHELPRALREAGNTQATKKKLSVAPIVLPANAIDLLGPVGGSVAVGDTIDPIFFVTKVNMEVKNASDAAAETKAVDVRFTLELRNNIYGEVSATHTDGTVTKDVFFGNVDRQDGTFTATSMKGSIKSVVIDGALGSENNTKTQSVSFEIKTKDVTIGTGTHLNAPLPIEWLQDTMAMYNVDGALEVVDLMSSTHAQKLEQEILEFIDDSFSRAGSLYSGSFDLRPSASYAGSPKEWREELKTVIDHYAIKMKNDSAFTNGKFVLIANPLDSNIITNVNWVFNHVTDDRGGVEVDFNLGAYSGANRYEIVSSPNVPQGVIRMLYVPSTPKQMTYKYYPYTFNVEKGYIDPNRPNVPSIMMTKRHTIEEMTPLAAEINVLSNTGS